MSTQNSGTVYLLHLARPLGNLANNRAQAAHYLGWSKGDATKRIADHIAGRGSALTRAAFAAGISLEVVKVWTNEDRNFERALKNKKNAKGICPICKKGYNEKAKIRMRRKRAS